MKRLRKLRLHLGCIFEPLLTLFTITGDWQAFDLNRATKDGSYRPPRIVNRLSSAHLLQTMLLYLGGGVK